MAVSDFVLLYGEDWIEVPNPNVAVRSNQMEELTFAGHVNGNDWPPITQWAEDSGFLPAGKVVIGARMFDLGSPGPGEIDVRIWLAFGPA